MAISPEKRKQILKDVRQLVLMAAIILTGRSVLADWYVVPTGSMKPTILEGDRVFVWKSAYQIRVPAAQDLATFWWDTALPKINGRVGLEWFYVVIALLVMSIAFWALVPRGLSRPAYIRVQGAQGPLLIDLPPLRRRLCRDSGEKTRARGGQQGFSVVFRGGFCRLGGKGFFAGLVPEPGAGGRRAQPHPGRGQFAPK